MEKQPEVRREVRFDDRRKELHVTATEEKPFKDGEEVLGSGTFETRATYNEEGIKRLYKDAQRDRTNAEQAIKRCKDLAGEKPTDEELKELEDHNKKQKMLREVGDYNKNKLDLEVNEEKLKQIVKSINQIKDSVGTRLKL